MVESVGIEPTSDFHASRLSRSQTELDHYPRHSGTYPIETFQHLIAGFLFDFPSSTYALGSPYSVLHGACIRPRRVSIRVIGAPTRSLGEQRHEELFGLLRNRCG